MSYTNLRTAVVENEDGDRREIRLTRDNVDGTITAFEGEGSAVLPDDSEFFSSRPNSIAKIRDYLAGNGPVSDFTLRCFVGMLESGEATAADFEAVGGTELAVKVKALKDGGAYA